MGSNTTSQGAKQPAHAAGRPLQLELTVLAKVWPVGEDGKSWNGRTASSAVTVFNWRMWWGTSQGEVMTPF